MLVDHARARHCGQVRQGDVVDDMVLEDMPVIPWGYGGFNSANTSAVTNVVKDGPFDQWALEKVQVVQ